MDRLRAIATLGQLAAVVTIMFSAANAEASPQLLCGIYDDGCCTICRLTECDTGGTHPEARCNSGSMLHSLDVDQAACSAAGIPDGAAYCAAQDTRPVGVCIPFDFSTEVEVADGIDNNCDGVFLDDERCDGVDQDLDGRVDEGAGACLERHLFVPVCWNGGDQADFDGVVERAERFFQESTLLDRCGIDRYESVAQKIWYEAAPLGTITCPAGVTTADQLTYTSLLAELKNSYDLRDWDYVTFATRLPANAQCIAGRTPGGGLIAMRSDGLNTPFPGEHIVFAHEWGHNIRNNAGVALGEEYRVDSGKPNTVSATLGCDPTTCCNGAHCNPDVDGHLCLGNEAKDLSSWYWGDPTPPPTYGDGSRCIMSNASAPGALTGDPITGWNSHRGWCQACLDHLSTFGTQCEDTFTGPQRRLEIAGRVDANGNVALEHYAFGDGRMGGGAPQGGDVDIEVYDAAGNFLAAFAPEAVSHSPEIPSDTLEFLSRMPVAPSVSGAITVVSVQNGAPISQVTGGGQPAVAVASDVIAECVAAAGTNVTLDGSPSFDPDGDTVRFAWSSTVALANGDSASPSGQFPLGTTAATLTVTDGTPFFDSVTIDVTVTDTTGPELQANAVLQETCLRGPDTVGLTPPTVMAECMGAGDVSFTAALVSVNGTPLPTPIAIDPLAPEVTLSPGTAIVEWTGTDSHGNATTVAQVVSLLINDESTACCPAGSQLRSGNGSPNWLFYLDGQTYCVFGKAGGDSIITTVGNDYLAGGAGADYIETTGSGNVINGGAGNDHLEMYFFGSGLVYGGTGNDVIHDTAGGTIYGNSGDDFIETDFVGHEIVPGPGRDTVYAGVGDDTVVIYDACEVEPFEILSGGFGQDTLVTPLTLTELFFRGVVVSGFETVIVTSDNRHLSECW